MDGFNFNLMFRIVCTWQLDKDVDGLTSRREKDKAQLFIMKYLERIKIFYGIDIFVGINMHNGSRSIYIRIFLIYI